MTKTEKDLMYKLTSKLSTAVKQRSEIIDKFGLELYDSRYLLLLKEIDTFGKTLSTDDYLEMLASVRAVLSEQEGDYKLGDIVQLGKLQLIAVKSDKTCKGCYLHEMIKDCDEFVGECSEKTRKDGQNIMFEVYGK